MVRTHSVFGEKVRQRRDDLRLTLRDFAIRAEVDPGNWSRVERGILAAPKDQETLARICDVLRLAPGSNERTELMYEADLASGRLPSDVLDNEELMEVLPLLFRRLRIYSEDQPELLDALKSLLKEG